MADLTPSARLKVKRDTFFIPDSHNGVYFRNNTSSFRMQGSMIDQWVEKLIPMFNGEHTLEGLTDGLPTPYRDRVYEIAEVLYHNGFVRDVTQDRPHQLADQVVKKYASQIEFLDSFGQSGAYRFQRYRQAKVLAVGSGSFFVSLVSALLESGLPTFDLVITDQTVTNGPRLMELVEHARKTDPEVKVKALLKKGSWREMVQPFDAVLYVAEDGDVEELRDLHAVCREEKKLFMPAIGLQQVGLAGPLVHPDTEGDWESAWRRLHHSVLRQDDPEMNAFSSTAGAMLANVIVFETFKKMTGLTELEKVNSFFLLDFNTLEGNWHSFLPHPLETRRVEVTWLEDIDLQEQDTSGSDSDELLLFFGQFTSKEAGIFHVWEEGDLKQLPLAQCRVQPVDPLSEGPARLLPDRFCSGLTHIEARRKAGLTGIEAYVSRAVDKFQEIDSREFVGIGAGETVSEGVYRGFKKCLSEELKKQLNQKKSANQISLSAIEDERCRFYLQALKTLKGEPIIGLGEEVVGFPVVWVGTNECWYGSADLNITMALRGALQQAVFKAQNEEDDCTTQVLEVSSIHVEEENRKSLAIPEEPETSEGLRSAIQTVEQNGKRLLVCELEVEPFFKEKLAGVFGVSLREEESR